MVGKPRRNSVTDEQIIESYRRHHSVFKVADELDIGSSTIHRVLMKHQEPRPGLEEWRRNATKFIGREQEIRDAYEAGATYAQLRLQFDPNSDSDYALKQALKRAGTELRENPAQLLKPGELEKIREMNAAGLGQVPISLALGRSQSFISRLMRKEGIPPISERMKGEGHPGWKGGRWVDSNGYVRVALPKDDPFAIMRMSDGYVQEHRIVMARKLGRPLLKTESVHHIDGNRGNNDPANLEPRQGKHGKHVVMCCLDCGSRNIGHVGLSKDPNGT